MAKRIGLLVVVLTCVGVRPARADGELTYQQMRQLTREIAAWQATFSQDDAAACDADQQARQSRGASGEWTEGDAKCEENIERAATFWTLVSGGTTPLADAVSAWCVAAAFVQSARDWLVDDRNRTGERNEAFRQEMRDKGWLILGSQYRIWIVLNTTVGFVTTGITFDPNQF